MKLMTNLIVLPMIFCLIGCPMACSPVAPDDDDSAGDDDDSSGDDDDATGDDDDSATGDDDDDSAVGVILMDEVRIFIERNCDNDMDDDHDGIADCGDLDCADAPDCVGF
jgi:hypothetical protein